MRSQLLPIFYDLVSEFGRRNCTLLHMQHCTFAISATSKVIAATSERSVVLPVRASTILHMHVCVIVWLYYMV